MEPVQKVRQISQKEVKEIDANNVDFFTLTDGTIIRIKGKEEVLYGTGVKNKEREAILTQNNEINGEEGVKVQSKNHFSTQKEIQTTKEESNQINQQEQNILSSQYQQEVQIQNEQVTNKKEKESNFQINSNLTSGNEALVQNTDEILQPGDNYGYYLSNDRGNIVQTQKNQKCTCNLQLPQGSYYNAHLIDVEIVENQLINELDLKNFSQTETQIFQQGLTKRKKLFKLVEAVPIIVTDIGKQYTNQNNNAQINFQQSNNNTYVVQNYRLQNLRKKMGMNYQNHFCSEIPSSKTYLNNQRMIKKRKQYRQYGNKIRNIKNQQTLLKQGYQGEGNWKYNNRLVNNEVQCTCPIGNLKMRKQYNMSGNEYDY